ncbi:MAG: Chagasin family peptidase inhibitor [Thermoleophilaceae bacterium]|nr:Chagasin family peptidase inhibitor [Thermoleophilaceae bacterium]
MRRATVGLLVAAGLLAGCGGGGDGLVFKDPRGTQTVEKGMQFSLEFTVNGGVGFDWVQVPARAGGVLEPVGTKTSYPSENRAGESGTKRFAYRAVRAGRQTLVFRHYFRSDPKESRTVTVVVGGG